MPPTRANGKICYVEIPATDIARSSRFYQSVFGWNIRTRGDGSIAFDDTNGEVSGTWVLGRPPAETPGLLFYIMVDSVKATVDAVVAHGGPDRAADRCGRAGDYSQVQRSSGERDRFVPGTGLMAATKADRVRRKL